MTQISRRLLLGGLLATAAGPALAGAPTRSLQPPPRPQARAPAAPPARPAARTGTVREAEALIAEAKLGGRLAYLVVDAGSGAVLEARSELEPLAPASTAKALTTLYALDRLGGGHRFRTRLIAGGPVSGGRLAGDLFLAGGGDPTLDTDALAELAAALRRAGVAEVAGRLRYWGGALPALHEITPGQPAHLGYNPAISGLNLNFNRVYFEWKRQGGGYAISMDARSGKRRPPVATSRMALSNRGAPLYTYREEAGAELWTVAQGALGKEGGRWLPVRHPGRYTAEVFRQLARAEGVTIAAQEPAARLPQGGQLLASRDSAPLAVVARDMLKFSTNLTAEVLGLAASGAASLSSSAAQMDRWMAARYGCTQLALVDHSGLGPASRVTAHDMVAALVAKGVPERLHPLLKAVEMRDAKGKPLRNHPLKVQAKTGTLNFVSSLVGYATLPGGRVLAFAILGGDLARRSALSEEARDQPAGAAAWNARAKALQQALLERWGGLYA